MPTESVKAYWPLTTCRIQTQTAVIQNSKPHSFHLWTSPLRASRFGARVQDFPPDETSLVGAAVGYAQSRLRNPVHVLWGSTHALVKRRETPERHADPSSRLWQGWFHMKSLSLSISSAATSTWVSLAGVSTPTTRFISLLAWTSCAIPTAPTTFAASVMHCNKSAGVVWWWVSIVHTC